MTSFSDSLWTAKLDAREYVEKSNPVGTAPAALMKRQIGKRETLRQLLTKKFGPLPRETVSRLEALESLEELDRYLDRVLTASSLDEMELGS